MSKVPTQRSYLSCWVAALLAVVASLITLLLTLDAPVLSTDQAPRIQSLRSAEFQLQVRDENQPAEGMWQTVALPDNWSRQRKAAQGIGWYRLTFELSAGLVKSLDLGIHVKRVSMAAEFYLNGHLLAPAMRTDAHMLRVWNTPQYRALPADWLRQGTNELMVRMYAYQDYNGGLSAVDWGDDTDIHALYSRTLMLHSSLPAAAIVALLVIGVLALAIGVRFGRDGSPFFLGLCSVAWAGRLFNNSVQVIPLDWFWWGWTVHSLSGWVPLFMLLYCHRYMGLKRRQLELFMVGYTALCTLLMGAYMAGWLSKDGLALIWLPFNLGTSLYMLTILWRLLRNSVGVTPFILAVALAFFLVGELHDRMISTASLEPWIGFEAAYWRPVSAMLLALAFCLLVADEFVRAIHEAQHSALAQERALAAERARMNREMHDGLGAQLITALRGVERGAFNKEQVAQLLQDGLDELRLLMDASDFSRSVHGALAAWRNQWDGRLSAIGITLRWQIDPGLEQLTVKAETTLHVMRVLQEAVTNAVKHGKASVIQVTAQCMSVPSLGLLLQVQDDGCGIGNTQEGASDQAGRYKGRGLANMQQRATQMGAQMQVQALVAPQRGTQVSLSLPLL